MIRLQLCKTSDILHYNVLGKEYGFDEFVPIGNFIVLENTELSQLNTEKIAASVKEAILKEPLKKIESLSDIRRGHSLHDYYCSNLMAVNNVATNSVRLVDAKHLLQPTTQADSAVIIFTKNPSTLTFMMRGRFLDNVHLDASATDFDGLPFAEDSIVQVNKTVYTKM